MCSVAPQPQRSPCPGQRHLKLPAGRSHSVPLGPVPCALEERPQLPPRAPCSLRLPRGLQMGTPEPARASKCPFSASPVHVPSQTAFDASTLQSHYIHSAVSIDCTPVWYLLATRAMLSWAPPLQLGGTVLLRACSGSFGGCREWLSHLASAQYLRPLCSAQNWHELHAVSFLQT